MDQRLKQRLVGAAVLASMVVIVVPELLDRSAEPARQATRVSGSQPDDDFSSRIIPLEESDDTRPDDVSSPPTSATSESSEALMPDDLSSDESTETGANASEVEPLASLSESTAHGSATVEVSDRTAPTNHDSRVPVPVPQPRPNALAAATASAARSPSGNGGEGGEKVGLSAWAIQLGSFASAKNAIDLRDRLRAAGYAAFVQPVYGDAGTMTRVYVGPELERTRAESTRQELEGEQSLKGIVVSFPGGDQTL